MCTIVSMSSTQKSKDAGPVASKVVEACSRTAHVRFQNFPGLGTRQTDSQTDTQPIPRNWLLDPRVHQHPFKAWRKKWSGTKFSCTSKGMQRWATAPCWYMISYNWLLGYLLYHRVQDVLHQPGSKTTTRNPLPNYSERRTSCLQRTTQAQPQGLNPNHSDHPKEAA